MAVANFPLVQFSKISVGSVFPVTTSYVQFQRLSMATLKTFICGDLSALQ